MIEAYAFLAAFTVQILAVSVLYPGWVIRSWRMQAMSFPAERLAQLYPGVDLNRAGMRFLARYRALHTGIAVLGLLLLSWLFRYMLRADWDEGSVGALVTAYFMVQVLMPIGFIAWFGIRFNRVHKRSSPEGKRKATLQRRGLFDFVSPFTVLLAALVYFLFAALVIYIQRDPFPKFAGLINIGAVTLAYAVNAFAVYVMLYGKKSNPFEEHADRLHRIGRTVKGSVYSCIVLVVFLSIHFMLKLLALQRWHPFAVSVFFVIAALLCYMGMTAPPSRPDADAPGADGRLTPGTRNLSA